MDARNIRCCLCWFTCLGALNFLVALLIAYRTLTGECKPEVCREHGTCLLNKDGYKCRCDLGYMGDQCEFRSPVVHIPSVHHGGMESNDSSTAINYGPMSNGSAVVVMTTLSSQSTYSPEVHAEDIRDSMNSAYWAFIVCYTIGSTSVFLLAFFLLNFLKRKLSKDFKGKEYYGIQYKPEEQTEEMEGQRKHLVSDASGLNVMA